MDSLKTLGQRMKYLYSEYIKQRAITIEKDIYPCFIPDAKEFNKVCWKELFKLRSKLDQFGRKCLNNPEHTV